MGGRKSANAHTRPCDLRGAKGLRTLTQGT